MVIILFVLLILFIVFMYFFVFSLAIMAKRADEELDILISGDSEITTEKIENDNA